MMKLHDFRLHEFAIWLALRRPTPDRFSYGPGTDFYSVRLIENESGTEFLARKTDGKISAYRILERELDREPLELSPIVDRSEIRFLHHYDYDCYEIDSIASFFLHFASPLPMLRKYSRRMRQEIFNLRLREIREQSDLLRYMIDRSCQSETILLPSHYEACNSIELFSGYYSNDVWGHKYNGIILNRFVLRLESLCEDGALEKIDAGYRIKPKAILRLDELESERIRHTQNLTGC